MIADEERREAARRLRETGEELGSAALLWYHIAKALGVRTATDGKTACDMLADLIEPSYSATTPHYSADRDALLELADELSKPMRDGGYSAEIARRIREACGVGS